MKTLLRLVPLVVLSACSQNANLIPVEPNIRIGPVVTVSPAQQQRQDPRPSGVPASQNLDQEPLSSQLRNQNQNQRAPSSELPGRSALVGYQIKPGELFPRPPPWVRSRAEGERIERYYRMKAALQEGWGLTDVNESRLLNPPFAVANQGTVPPAVKVAAAAIPQARQASSLAVGDRPDDVLPRAPKLRYSTPLVAAPSSASPTVGEATGLAPIVSTSAAVPEPVATAVPTVTETEVANPAITPTSPDVEPRSEEPRTEPWAVQERPRSPEPELRLPSLPQAEGGRYFVQPGSTLYRISKETGQSLRSLIEMNHLEPPFRLFSGQVLTIAQNTKKHRVTSGETPHAIAETYKISIASLASLNDLKSPYLIRPGQELRLPSEVTSAADGARQSARPMLLTVRPTLPLIQRTSSGLPKAPFSVTKPVTRGGNREEILVRNPPRRSGIQFAWPAEGRVTQAFGARPDGIWSDGLEVVTKADAPVRAADNGVVAFAGDGFYRTLGNLVLIRHQGGFVSAYAWMDRIEVSRGDIVQRGQRIGYVGQIAGNPEPAFYFQLRLHGKSVDPIRHLEVN